MSIKPIVDSVQAVLEIVIVAIFIVRIYVKKKKRISVKKYNRVIIKIISESYLRYKQLQARRKS